MPPSPRPGGRFRRFLIVILLLVAAAGIYAFLSVGTWLAPEDPLTKADAIFTFAGTIAERPLEAIDLYKAGYAPIIVITRDTDEGGVSVANQRGAAVPSHYDLTRDLMRRLGVPDSAILSPDRIHDSTAAEAQTLHELVERHGWKRVIVVSSKYHLRRVTIACRRVLRGTGVSIMTHATRYDRSVPREWWKRRSDIRWVFSELPKVVAYGMGLGV